MTRFVSCWQCGADLPDAEARFCPACGAQLRTLGFWEEFSRKRGWLWVSLSVGLVVLVTLGVWLAPGMLAGDEPAVLPTSAAATLLAPTLTLIPVVPPALTVAPTAALAPTLTPRPAATASPEPSATADLAVLLLEAANRFQEAKAYSQATGDTSRLAEALAGDALQRQIELVERWRGEGCTWEITLDEPLTVRILETRDGAWARIEVAKVETRLLTCDGALASETRGDAYTTGYVVELIDGAWVVTERE